MGSSVTEEIVKFITNISYERLTAKTIEAGKSAVLDCLGVALAGCGEISGKIVSEYVKDTGRPEAGVIGGGFKVSADQAAWINGTIAHALDYDDYFAPPDVTPYHPTSAILPAVMAIGEKYHLSGKDVLLAYIAGFEVEARIALICAEPSYELGWHTTSTIGSLGAAAAIAKALKLDDEKTMMALGIASSLAGGLRKNFGTMTKPLHAGNAARNGVVAAELAQRGFTADKNILDSPLSFCEVIAGESNKNQRAISQTEFYIVNPGIAFKPYPSCAYTHWAIDAALGLKRELALNPQDVVRVECHTSSGLRNLLIHSRPETPLEAKFSLEYCVAIALTDGEVTLRQFNEVKVKDNDVKELIKKIEYVHPPEMGTGLVNMGGEVVIRLKNAKVHSLRVDIAEGNPRNPLSYEKLSNKFKDCAGSVMTPEDTNRALELISHLVSVSDIAELMDIMTSRAMGSGFKTSKTKKK